MKWLGKILSGGKTEETASGQDEVDEAKMKAMPITVAPETVKPAVETHTDPAPQLKPGERHRVSNKDLRQYCTALEQQVNFVLEQNNNLGRINVSALNALERIEAIVNELHGTFSMALIGLFVKPLRVRLFRDLSRIVGQTSRFTIRDEKGNLMVKAEHAPDSQLVAKVAEAEKADEKPMVDVI